MTRNADETRKPEAAVSGDRENACAAPGETGEDERLCRAFSLLADWFAKNARPLPWREKPDAYRVWISEIMLQQTRIETVIPYYRRFLREIPDAEALADISEDRLLKLWEGLGYYSRARNLKKAAAVCRERFGGKLPGNYDDLLALPGIGPYTAGAVSSIAYGEKRAAVDGNVIRVLSRILEDPFPGEADRSAVTKRYAERVAGVIEASELNPGTVNESLMELGETICLPKEKPLCGSCPVSEVCLALERGTQQKFPPETARKARRIVERTLFILADEKSVCLRQRPGDGLLALLWELPGCDGFLSAKEAAEYFSRLLGTACAAVPAGNGKHIFTHLEWHMKSFRIQVPGRLSAYAEKLSAAGMKVVPKSGIGEDYAIPSAFSAWRRY
ncbi:MAG: A/G-specific adenine glycosylase [Lachnospiraceae bacterium]|jgi:A/G-specific adenine glycosylase